MNESWVSEKTMVSYFFLDSTKLVYELGLSNIENHETDSFVTLGHRLLLRRIIKQEIQYIYPVLLTSSSLHRASSVSGIGREIFLA